MGFYVFFDYLIAEGEFGESLIRLIIGFLTEAYFALRAFMNVMIFYSGF